ncbi:MAG: hypothetical protein J6W84_04050 [Bacteroidales bacterium]|nr:hypothetical protein [Bacteroidales bacterium]
MKRLMSNIQEITPNDQRSEVKNPTSKAFVNDLKNRIRQLQREEFKTPEKIGIMKEYQRLVSKISTNKE